MDSRFRRTTRVLIGGLALGFILSGCNEYYSQPDYDYNPGYTPGYTPGYDDVSDRRMIKNCKLRVENKIGRKLDYAPRIKFGYVDVSDISRSQSRVKGDAYAQERNDNLRVDYRCIVERDNGKVTDVKLDWRNKPANADKKSNAASTCKSYISKKVQSDIKGQVGVDFGKHDSSGMSNNRRRITGKAHITTRRGPGKIGYECVVDTHRMRVSDAHYRWTQHLPSAGNDGYNKDMVRRKCQKAIVNRLRVDNYENAKIQSTSIRNVGKADLIVEGKIKMTHEGSPHRARYECRINGHNGKVKSATYKLVRQ